MTFDGIDAWWWPYVFILVAGWAATDAWRFLGVYLGGRISEESEIMVLVRCVATALVAAVISSLLLNPGGGLAETPIALRLAAVGAGFATYMLAGRSVLLAILVAEALFIAGMFLV